MNSKPIAVFPGSFDPYTLAHHELVLNASKFFRVVILVCHNPAKNTGMFTIDERLSFISKTLQFVDKTEDEPVIECDDWTGLVTDYCRENNIKYIIRGIQYKNAAEELDLAHIYYDDGQIKTIFFPTYNLEHLHISSTRVREYIKNYNQTWEYMVPAQSVETIRTCIYNKRK